MEGPVNPFQVFAWFHLQFLVLHFVLYSAFWMTGFPKFTSTLKNQL